MSRSARRAALGAICAWIALGLSAGSFAEVCGTETPVWVTGRRGSRAEKRVAVDRAEERAFLSLAERAVGILEVRESLDQVRVVGAGGSGDSPGFLEESRYVRAVRSYYRVDENLRGGTFRRNGSGEKESISYCVEDARFRAVQASLLEERGRQVSSLRARMRGVELALEEGRMAWAAEEVADLAVEVRVRVMEGETYVSPITSESKPVGDWLDRWNRMLGVGADWTYALVGRSREQIRSGYLGLAGQTLSDVQRVDPHNVLVPQMRAEIDDLRRERDGFLALARKRAESGRFSAARAALAEAEAIDRGDVATLDRARAELREAETLYRHYNPRYSAGVHLSYGSLGADPGYSRDAMAWELGAPLRSEGTLGYGLGGAVRVGRYFELRASGSFGFANFTYDSGAPVAGDESFEWQQWTVGVDFRTPRSARRGWCVRVGGGIASESASVPDLGVQGVVTSDSRTGSFARFGVDWGLVSVFVQQGIGFEDEIGTPNSWIGWSDSTQLGVSLFY